MSTVRNTISHWTYVKDLGGNLAIFSGPKDEIRFNGWYWVSDKHPRIELNESLPEDSPLWKDIEGIPEPEIESPIELIYKHQVTVDYIIEDTYENSSDK